jgi:hypothetical protein
VDGVGIYKTSAPYDCFVKVKGCLIEDMVYVYPDLITTSHTDGTHNDCIQIQGGNNIEIVGNALVGTCHKLAGTGTSSQTEWLFTDPLGPAAPLGWSNGSNLIIQDNVGAPNFDSTVIIESNYFRYGKTQMSPKSTSAGASWVYRYNKHSSVNFPARNGAPPPTHNSYWIRFDDITVMGTVTGLTSGGALANTTNVWLDGASAGLALTEPRASGVAPNLVS